MSKRAYSSELLIESPGLMAEEWTNKLVHGYVDDSAAVPAMAVLQFRDPEHLLLSKTRIKVGVPLRLFAKTADEQTRVPLFSGEVTALEAEIDGTGAFTTVRALDHSHRLLRGRRVVAYRNMTASDIVRQVARRARVAVGRIDPTRTVYEQVAQPNTTDWEFLRRLAQDNDAVLLVDDGKLSFRRTTAASGAPGVATPAEKSPYVLQFGVNLVSLRAAVTSAGQVNQVRVRSWDVRTKRALVGSARADKSEELLLGVTPAQVASPFGTAELLVTDVPYGTQAEVNSVATALAADVTGSFGELEAVVEDAPHLRAGTPVTFAKVGAPFEGKYTVTRAHHAFGSKDGYLTQITVSGGQDRSLYGLAAGASAPARPTRQTGLVIATVTDAKDPEQKGRVKLAFPWLAADYESDWARTVQLGGVRGGGVFSPEVGDEVLVGFEQGFLDRPYVIGGLYNGRDKPSKHQVPLVDKTSGRVNRRSLVSRSGHRLELLDPVRGPQGVRLQTGNGKVEIKLDQQDTSVVVRSDGTVEIKAARQINVTGRGVTIDAGVGRLTLTGASVAVNGRSAVLINGAIVKIN
jgi:phage protein D